MKAGALFTTALMLLMACRPSPPAATEKGTEGDVRSAVEATFDTLSKAIAAHDWDRVEDLMADGGDVTLAINGEILVGRPAIMAGFRADSSILKYIDYRWEDSHVRVMGPTAAIHSARFWERLAMRSGDTVEVRGAFTNAFQKLGARWKVVHMAGSHAPSAQ